MTSITAMILMLDGCLGTGDLTAWEEEFVRSLLERKRARTLTTLSENQVEALERLWRKHFA